MPLKRLVLLQTINRTSLILPTEEKNSSTSLARTLWDNCMTKMVRASRSSGVSWTSGDGSRSLLGGESLPPPPIRPNRPTVPDPNLGGDRRLLRSRDLERERRSPRPPRSRLLLRRCLSRLRLRRLRSRLLLRRLSLLRDLLPSLSLLRLLPCFRSLDRDLDRFSRLSLLRLLERLLQKKVNNCNFFQYKANANE